MRRWCWSSSGGEGFKEHCAWRGKNFYFFWVGGPEGAFFQMFLGWASSSKSKLNAAFEAVELGLEFWVAWAMPAVSNPVLLLNLEKNVVRDGRKLLQKGSLSVEDLIFPWKTRHRGVHIFERFKLRVLKLWLFQEEIQAKSLQSHGLGGKYWGERDHHDNRVVVWG